MLSLYSPTFSEYMNRIYMAYKNYCIAVRLDMLLGKVQLMETLSILEVLLRFVCYSSNKTDLVFRPKSKLLGEDGGKNCFSGFYQELFHLIQVLSCGGV